MCYSVYISTDSPEDLTRHNTELVTFDRSFDAKGSDCLGLLDLPRIWHVGSKSGCGCSFRHLPTADLGFSIPVDWYEEDPDDIEATGELYALLDELLSSGYKVDLIDLWNDARAEHIVTREVSFDEVARTAFRLFENHKFKLTKKAPQGGPEERHALKT